MTRISAADHANDAMAFDYPAILTNRLHWRSYFH